MVVAALPCLYLFTAESEAAAPASSSMLVNRVLVPANVDRLRPAGGHTRQDEDDGKWVTEWVTGWVDSKNVISFQRDRLHITNCIMQLSEEEEKDVCLSRCRIRGGKSQ